MKIRYGENGQQSLHVTVVLRICGDELCEKQPFFVRVTRVTRVTLL